jgi:hypothetical protein
MAALLQREVVADFTSAVRPEKDANTLIYTSLDFSAAFSGLSSISSVLAAVSF